jgi:hypothetical protein
LKVHLWYLQIELQSINGYQAEHRRIRVHALAEVGLADRDHSVKGRLQRVPFKYGGGMGPLGTAALEHRAVSLDLCGQTAGLAFGEALAFHEVSNLAQSAFSVGQISDGFVLGCNRLLHFEARQLVIQSEQSIAGLDAVTRIYLDFYQAALDIRRDLGRVRRGQCPREIEGFDDCLALSNRDLHGRQSCRTDAERHKQGGRYAE